MKRISWKGVVLGGLTDLGGSWVLGIVIGIYVMATHGGGHMPREQATAVIRSALGEPALRAAQLLGGFSCTVLGGYVSAWIARHDELLNGALASVPCLAIGILGIASGRTAEPLLVQLGLMILTPGMGFLGGWIRRAHAGSPLASAEARPPDPGRS